MQKFYNEALEWVKPSEEYSEAKKKKSAPEMEDGFEPMESEETEEKEHKGKGKKYKDDMGGASGDSDNKTLKKACALLKKVAKKADDKTKEEIEDFLASC